jgi:hypothetical protein
VIIGCSVSVFRGAARPQLIRVSDTSTANPIVWLDQALTLNPSYTFGSDGLLASTRQCAFSHEHVRFVCIGRKTSGGAPMIVSSRTGIGRFVESLFSFCLKAFK